MLHHYRDIRDRIAEPPRWWDENGTPRYCEFSPDAVANIYADEIALLLIACQACLTQFKVAMTSDMMQPGRFDHEGVKHYPLAEEIRAKRIHYGDPPNVGCCPAGASMNCEDLRVLGYWVRYDKSVERDGEKFVDPDSLDWRRDEALEVELPDAEVAGLLPTDSRA